jgi:hypothetical protein
MSDASHSPQPARSSPAQTDDEQTPVPDDPGDLGTAYGMEMSIEAPDQTAADDGERADAPLAWMRRWVARHKAG